MVDLDLGPYLAVTAVLAFIVINNRRIYTNDKEILELQKHHHNSPVNQSKTGMPVNKDGELLQRLDGIRGWY